jgi:putative DNA primase/helicase
VFSSDILILTKLANFGWVNPDPEADLRCASPALRPLVERLLAVAYEKRQAIWDEFLAGRCGQALTAAGMPALESEPGPTGPQIEPACPPAAAATAAPHEPAELKRGARITCAADIVRRDVEWLWPGRVPLGMLTMLAGDPKLGKGFVALDMATALSRGLPLPQGGFASRTGSTLLMSAEDAAAETVIARLTTAGANLAKIHLFESVILGNGSEALPSLRYDIDVITAAAARFGDCKLIVIDPVSAYLEGVDDHRNAALRSALSPLKTLAERLGAAVVLINHLTKKAAASGKHRVLGSIAYVGACRANHLFVRDPKDPDNRRVLMLDNGSNLAPTAPALAYTIEDGGDGPRIIWSDEPVPITVDEALRPESGLRSPGQERELSECEEWLREALAGAPVLAADLRRAGRDAGFSWTTLRRARSRIGAVTRRDGFGPGSKCYWQPRNASKREPTSAMDSSPTP